MRLLACSPPQGEIVSPAQIFPRLVSSASPTTASSVDILTTYYLDAHLPTTYMKAPPPFPLPPSISLASIFPRYRLARGSSPSQAKIILYTLIYLLTHLFIYCGLRHTIPSARSHSQHGMRVHKTPPGVGRNGMIQKALSTVPRLCSPRETVKNVCTSWQLTSSAL